MRTATFVSNKGFTEERTFRREDGVAMSSVPLVPIQRPIRDVTGDLHVVVAASEQGYRETALEACLLAKEKLQAIREELLRPEPGISACEPKFFNCSQSHPLRHIQYRRTASLRAMATLAIF